jgi:hypothetical protein
MQELEKRIGQLRIVLADIQGKHVQLAEMENQYRVQLSRIVEFVVYREGEVGNALSLMAEVETKLNEVTTSIVHLAMLESKTSMELEVMLLTKRVSEARSQLTGLLEQQQELAARLEKMSGVSEGAVETHTIEEEAAQMEEIRAIYDEVESEITRLHKLITEASERAANTVQPKTKSRA